MIYDKNENDEKIFCYHIVTKIIIGATSRNRTEDLPLTRRMLYLLS